MFVRMARFKLKAELAAAAVDAYLREGIPRVRDASGNRDCYLLEPVAAGAPYVACTLWEDEAAAQRYESSGLAAEVAGTIRSAFAEPPVLETYRAR
jgi:heme-degrading monooxygenase HmoA